MVERPRLSRVMHVAGALVLLAAVLFLGREFVRNWTAVGAWRPDSHDVWVLGLCVLAYSAALVVLAEIWHRILSIFSLQSRRRTWPSLAATQIARYLPGNFAHLFGRALWLRGGGLSDGTLAHATGLELAVIPAGALLALALTAPLVPIGTITNGILSEQSLAFVPLIVLLATGLILARSRGALGRWSRHLAGPLLLAAVFMFVLGGVFAAIVGLMGPVPLPLAVASAIIAWLVGYATPGAPGGLGVRETVLVVLMGDVLSPADALLAAILFRIVTVLADVVCFMFGLALAWRFRARREVSRTAGSSGG